MCAIPISLKKWSLLCAAFIAGQHALASMQIVDIEQGSFPNSLTKVIENCEPGDLEERIYEWSNQNGGSQVERYLVDDRREKAARVFVSCYYSEELFEDAFKRWGKQDLKSRIYWSELFLGLWTLTNIFQVDEKTRGPATAYTAAAFGGISFALVVSHWIATKYYLGENPPKVAALLPFLYSGFLGLGLKWPPSATLENGDAQAIAMGICVMLSITATILYYSSEGRVFFYDPTTEAQKHLAFVRERVVANEKEDLDSILGEMVPRKRRYRSEVRENLRHNSRVRNTLLETIYVNSPFLGRADLPAPWHPMNARDREMYLMDLAIERQGNIEDHVVAFADKLYPSAVWVRKMSKLNTSHLQEGDIDLLGKVMQWVDHGATDRNSYSYAQLKAMLDSKVAALKAAILCLPVDKRTSGKILHERLLRQLERTLLAPPNPQPILSQGGEDDLYEVEV